MSKRNTKKKNEQMIKYECNYLSEDRMIEIHAQAYYKALKRIEQEKEEVKEQITCKKENKAIDNILFWLNLGVCPFKISKRFKLNKNAYEGILVAPISSLLECIGALI